MKFSFSSIYFLSFRRDAECDRVEDTFRQPEVARGRPETGKCRIGFERGDGH